MSEEQVQRLVVVGRGVTSCLTLFSLLQNLKAPIEIFWIGSDSLAPECTTRSTAIIASFGDKDFNGPTGKLHHQSLAALSEFILKYNPEGIFDGQHFHLLNTAGDYRRYQSNIVSGLPTELKLKVGSYQDHGFETCRLVDSKKFINWLNKEIGKLAETKKCKIKIIDSLVLKIENNILTLQNKTQIIYDQIVLATGGMGKFFGEFLPQDEELKNSKMHVGSYVQFENVFWGEKNFVITINKSHLIYQAWHNKLLINTADSREHVLLHPFNSELKLAYEHFKEIMEDLVFPLFEKGVFFAGVRHKCSKRLPVYRQLSSGVFGHFGMYKNGFLWPFYTSQIMAQQLTEVLIHKKI